MKNIYILISIIIFSTLIIQTTFAEESIVQVKNEMQEETDKNLENVVDFSKMRFNENENPITYKYFNDYADLLRSKIKFNKFYFFGYRPFNDWYMKYHYKLHKDGSISELHSALGCSPRSGKPINKYYENIIQTVLPPSYPKNMEIGDVDVTLVVSTETKTKTEILFIKESGIYQGNTVIIYLHKKSWDSVIRGNYNYLRYGYWRYNKDVIID